MTETSARTRALVLTAAASRAIRVGLAWLHALVLECTSLL